MKVKYWAWYKKKAEQHNGKRAKMRNFAPLKSKYTL